MSGEVARGAAWREAEPGGAKLLRPRRAERAARFSRLTARKSSERNQPMLTWRQIPVAPRNNRRLICERRVRETGKPASKQAPGGWRARNPAALIPNPDLKLLLQLQLQPRLELELRAKALSPCHLRLHRRLRDPPSFSGSHHRAQGWRPTRTGGPSLRLIRNFNDLAR